MLFKILHGDDSRISTDITPFHEGYCYVTHGGYMYVDINVGTKESPNNQRVKLNAKDAETITGVSLEELKNEFTNQDAVVLAEAQDYTNQAVEAVKGDITTQDAVVLHEAQTYVDEAIAAYAASRDLQVYVQSTTPDNAPIGSIWVDTSVTSPVAAEEVSF